MQTLVLPRFDDMHAHVRDNVFLTRTVRDIAAWAERAVIMPNLVPAIDTISAVEQYRRRIEAHLPPESEFTPLMTLYLSANLTIDSIQQAKNAGVVAVKWYPKGATTHSAQGIAQIHAFYPLLEAMQKAGLLLLIHGEVTDDEIDIFDREAVFIDRVLEPLRRDFPQLKMVLEHITTAAAVDYVMHAACNLAATITPQHLLYNRNQLLVGGLKPHYYCLPILKTERDRKRLLEAAISGDPRFFLGTDSAPHLRTQKECSCGCAGCYSAFHAPALYATIFERADALPRLHDFACRFGADYYGLPYNNGSICLQRQECIVPDVLSYGEGELVPLSAGMSLPWTLADKN